MPLHSVHFDNLDWKNEDSKSERGPAVRKERRALLKQEKLQRRIDTEAKKRHVYDILRTGKVDQLESLYCEDKVFKVLLDSFLDEVGAGAGHGNCILQRLNHFRDNSPNFLYRNLSNAAKNNLPSIYAVEAFENTYFPREVTSSEDEESTEFRKALEDEISNEQEHEGAS